MTTAAKIQYVQELYEEELNPEDELPPIVEIDSSDVANGVIKFYLAYDPENSHNLYDFDIDDVDVEIEEFYDEDPAMGSSRVEVSLGPPPALILHL